MRECLPGLSRVALLWDPASGRLQVEALTRIARDLGIATDLLEVRARSARQGDADAAAD